MTNEDETKNIVGDLELYLKTKQCLPIEKEKHDGLKECRHLRVRLDDQNHTVTCSDCKKQLDAFWYLSLLAHEWKQRRYYDKEGIEAYRKLEEERRNALRKIGESK